MARHDTSRPRRPSKITVPDHAHPMARVVFSEMQRQGVTYDEIEYRAGVLRSTLKAWRQANRPGLDTIEAALGALGWAVLPVPQYERLPEELQSELTRLSNRWGDINPMLCNLLATVCRTPIVASDPIAAVALSKPRRRSKEPNPFQTSFLEESAA